MKKATAEIFALFFSLSLSAQIGYVTPEANPFFCQPGVTHKSPGKGASFTYTFNPQFEILPPDAENPSEVRRNERFDTRLKVPIVNGDKSKFMLGFQYTLEKYHFDDIVPENFPLFNRLNDTELKTAGVAAYYVRSINHKFYTSFRFSASWHGDYDKFISVSNRYATYRAAGLLGVKKRKDLEYGIGLVFQKSFRRTNLLPFGFYNRTFNEHWGIEASLPVSIKARYNFSPRTLVLFGPEYSSQNYALNVTQPSDLPGLSEKAPYHYHRSNIDLTATFMQQMSGWTWLEFKFGYSNNLSSNARDLPDHNTFRLKPSGNLTGQISFFISPPRHGE